jgi:hypothetical protein
MVPPPPRRTRGKAMEISKKLLALSMKLALAWLAQQSEPRHD